MVFLIHLQQYSLEQLNTFFALNLTSSDRFVVPI